eukprot:bmy_22002T0
MADWVETCSAGRKARGPRASRNVAGTKQTSALKQEDASKRKAELEALVRKKIEFERKALRIVEQLLEENITEEFLRECVPKQKYKISTKTNKVYDITERKCFCSNFCYKASKFFEAQIPETPVWVREEER